MDWRHLMIGVSTIAISLALFAPNVTAQTARAFVSALGSDSLACTTPITPCRTIGGAMAKVEPGGEVVVITSGSYPPFTATKAVTVLAARGVHAGITSTTGDAVSIFGGPTDVVVIRGLTLTGLGGARGVVVHSGRAVHLENLIISGFTENGVISGAPGQLFVKDTTSRNNGSTGIVLSTLGLITAVMEGLRLENNGFGIVLQGKAVVTIRNSVASGNVHLGFQVNQSTAGDHAEMNLENCTATGNSAGIQAASVAGSAAIVRVSNCTVTNNALGLSVLGPGASLLSRGNNTVEGNATDGAPSGTYAAK